MNMKEAKRLKPGAIVREAWEPRSWRFGLVLAKQHVRANHNAKVLGGWKDERYDVTVHWFDGPRPRGVMGGVDMRKPNPEQLQNWEIMLVSHV